MLSPVLRMAWEFGKSQTMTKKQPRQGDGRGHLPCRPHHERGVEAPLAPRPRRPAASAIASCGSPYGVPTLARRGRVVDSTPINTAWPRPFPTPGKWAKCARSTNSPVMASNVRVTVCGTAQGWRWCCSPAEARRCDWPACMPCWMASVVERPHLMAALSLWTTANALCATSSARPRATPSRMTSWRRFEIGQKEWHERTSATISAAIYKRPHQSGTGDPGSSASPSCRSFSKDEDVRQRCGSQPGVTK